MEPDAVFIRLHIEFNDMTFFPTLTYPELLTRDEAARYLGLKPQTLAVWASTGRYELPFIRAGRYVRYRKQDLDRWLDSRVFKQGHSMET